MPTPKARPEKPRKDGRSSQGKQEWVRGADFLRVLSSNGLKLGSIGHTRTTVNMHWIPRKDIEIIRTCRRYPQRVIQAHIAERVLIDCDLDIRLIDDYVY